jgi:hypothetical protein
VLKSTLVIAVTALGLAPAGLAKGYPVTFDRATVAPGDEVTARALASFYELDVGLYLLDVRVIHQVRHFLPRDPRLVEVGTLDHQGRLTFDLPALPPGRYTSALFVRGGFYVNDPAHRAEYAVRGTMALNVGPRERLRGSLSPALAILALAGLAARRLRIVSA